VSARAEVTVVAAPTPEAERRAAGRRRVESQRLASRGALLTAAAEARADVSVGPDLRIEEGPGWHSSVSHVRAWVAAAVAPDPVGVDVEPVQERRPELVAEVLDAREVALLGGDDPEHFVRAWTAKEAVLKRAGVGLTELSRCRIAARPEPDVLVLAHRGREHVVHQRLHQGHVFAVTVGAGPVRWIGLREGEAR
jgi:4'-phosphopantetheinyl transferase